MVSPDSLKTELRQAFDELRGRTLDVNHYYRTPLFDVVFDLMTAETMIAGVADTFLTGGPLSPEALVALGRPLPLDGRIWRTASGGSVDISGSPEVQSYAQLLERVRAIAHALARNRT